MNIDLSNIHWENIAIDKALPRSRLLAAVRFNGVYHHLEAIEVQTLDSQFMQSAACPSCDEILTKYHDATGGDGPFSTVQIAERTYALFLTPYCQ